MLKIISFLIAKINNSHIKKIKNQIKKNILFFSLGVALKMLNKVQQNKMSMYGNKQQ